MKMRKVLARNISWLRSDMGWTQRLLAKRARVSQATVSRIERGLNVQLDSITKLARALRVETALLFVSP
jgi:transcriptional regulator with XRE-family HTH domain